jgi:hypothetical protein
MMLTRFPSHAPIRGIRSLGAVAALLALLLATVACEAEPEATDGLPNLDTLPTVEIEEVLRIGSLDDPDYGFSRIVAIDVDSHGNLYVAEGQDREIRVYTPDGELSHRFGGAGEGPGEFGGISRMGLAGDTVWVVDDAQNRLTLFSTDGTALSSARFVEATAPLHSPGWHLRYLPRVRDAEGYFPSDGGMSVLARGGSPERDSIDVPIIRFGSDGEVADTAGWLPRVLVDDLDQITVGQSTFHVPRVPDTRTRRVLTPWGLVIVEQELEASTPRVRVLRTTHGGDTVQVQDFAFDPQPFPDEVLESLAIARTHVTGPMIAFIDGEIEQWERHEADTARARERVLDAMVVPAAQPAVQGIHPAADGSLWLERERTDETLRRWTLLDASDEPIGELLLPRDHRLLRVDGDTFWLQERDDFDVPWIVEYRLRGG